MRICFTGAGSIGCRHIKNLKSIMGNDIVIDLLRSGKGSDLNAELKNDIADIYYDLDDLGVYDAIFITNPTAMHYDTLSDLLDHSDAFFIEKPVFLTGEEDLTPFSGRGKKYYVACPLRYTNVLQWIRNNVDFDSVYSVRCISSSYLPQWRTSDYRSTYSAKKELGGGVSVDLIHEWDYIYYLTGSLPLRVESMIGRKSDLEIDSDDVAVYIADYGRYIVEIHLDYFGRSPIRVLELFTRDDTIRADLIQQKILLLKDNKEIDLVEERDEYQKKELKTFISIVEGKIVSPNSLEEACAILKIARGKKCLI